MHYMDTILGYKRECNDGSSPDNHQIWYDDKILGQTKRRTSMIFYLMFMAHWFVRIGVFYCVY